MEEWNKEKRDCSKKYSQTNASSNL